MARKTAKTQAVVAAATSVPVITSIKGFGGDLVCKGDGYSFQYEIGKTFTHDGPVKACRSGFHAYPVEEHPLTVFSSYAPAGSRFFEVEQSGTTSRERAKLASAVITVKVELSISDLVKRAWDYVWSRAILEEGASATGDSGAASATGDRGAASATGYSGAASATGYSGAASATGYSGAASATGDSGAASATGYRGAASATGYRGAASATGDSGAASAKGRGCGAYATGFEGRVSGNAGSPLHLDERLWHPGFEDHGKVIAVWAGIAGQNGIKPDTFYMLKEGQPVEVASC